MCVFVGLVRLCGVTPIPRFSHSLILVMIGHNRVSERVARQIHVVLVGRGLYSLSVLGKHH